jgi:hypothetical protein
MESEAPLSPTLRTLAIAAAVAMSAALVSAQISRQLFVTVVDQSGNPVTDLAADEFSVTEHRLPRRIDRAALAVDPMRIALIVDSGDAVAQPINQFRAGLHNFFDGLPDGTEVAIMSIGRQARLRLQPTADRKKLQEAAAGFFGDGGGAAILDGLIESHSRFLRKAPGRRPVIVVVTTDGPSAGTIREDTFDRFLKEIHGAGIAVNAVVVSTRGGGTPTVIALTAAQATGGYYEAIAAATALPDKMKELAAHLTTESRKAGAQYRIEYASAVENPAEAGVEVSVSRAGVRVFVTERPQLK